MENLDRRVKTLEQEWNSTLDRVNRMLGRIAKRTQIDAEGLRSNGQGELPLSGRPLTLTERQSNVQAEILERRNKGLSNVLPR